MELWYNLTSYAIDYAVPFAIVMALIVLFRSIFKHKSLAKAFKGTLIIMGVLLIFLTAMQFFSKHDVLKHRGRLVEPIGVFTNMVTGIVSDPEADSSNSNDSLFLELKNLEKQLLAKSKLSTGDSSVTANISVVVDSLNDPLLLRLRDLKEQISLRAQAQADSLAQAKADLLKVQAKADSLIAQIEAESFWNGLLKVITNDNAVEDSLLKVQAKADSLIAQIEANSSFLERSLEESKKIIEDNPDWWHYLVVIIYVIILFVYARKYFVEHKYWKTGLITILGLSILVIFQSSFLPSDWGSIGFWRAVIGILISLHWWWRHESINKPMDWNVDPEAAEADRGPQKHLYGLWGNALFHLCFFVSISPFSGLMWYIKAPLFLEFLVLATFYVMVMVCMGKTESVGTMIKGYWSPVKVWFKDASWLAIVLMIIVILGTFFVMFVLSSIDIPLLIIIISILPLTFVLGAIYEPHIRGRLVLMWFKKPIFDSWLLLGNEYLDSGGLKFTLLPSWLWRVKIFLVDFATWEVENIETSEIPTLATGRGKKKAGLPIKILCKATVQRFDPKRWLAMGEEDRHTDQIKIVVVRYVLGALRDMTRKITYDEAKVGDWYQYAVRRQEVDAARIESLKTDGSISPAEFEIFEQKYRDHSAHLEIKVNNQGELVKHDEEGTFKKATFFEYLDWLLLTMTGCRLVEFDVLDVSADEIVELAEKRKVASELEKIIRKNLGEAEGNRRAAEIKKVSDFVVANENSEAGIKALIDLTGAEKAGLIFQLFKGLENKLNS